MTTFLNLAADPNWSDSQQADTEATIPLTEPDSADPRGAAREFIKLRFNLEDQALDDRIQQVRAELMPRGFLQNWFVDDIALATIRVEQYRKDGDRWRLRQACRSPLAWQFDRQAAAAELAQGLPRKPEVVRAKLKQSLYGCDFLIRRFRSLTARVLGNAQAGPQRPLDENGRKLALDALGVPLAEREGPTLLDPVGNDGTDVAVHQAAVLETQIVELQRHRAEELVPLDDIDRKASEEGQTLAALDPTLRAIRRDENLSRRQLKWAFEMFEKAKKRDPQQNHEASSSTGTASAASQFRNREPHSSPNPASTVSESTLDRIARYNPQVETPSAATPTTTLPEPAPTPEPAAAATEPAPVAAAIPAPSPALASSASYTAAKPNTCPQGRPTLASAMAPPRKLPPIVNPHRDKRKGR